jgi:hypothetical protein
MVTRVWNQAMARLGHDAKGQPIGSFRYHLAAAASYERSREAERAQGAPGSGVQTIRDQTELERVEKRIKEINESVDSHVELPPDARAERKKLRERREVLKRQLGFAV